MSDTSLHSYRAKRDFTVTTEPPPRDVAPGAEAMFVVQKHTAHRAGLHWDFRLEHGGVLWSWAVPKGPSLDPADLRMAIHVEDHPVDYAAFQGTIPDGAYGAGSVETWDHGTWQPLDDPDAGLRKGSLSFILQGKRLAGWFTLARLHRRDRRKPEAWLLIKGHDEHARDGVGAPEIEQETRTPPKRKTARATRAPVPGAIRGTLPERQAPQLCTLVTAPPVGEEWLSEVKLDGYRIIASIDQGQVRLLTRKGLDWTDRMPAVANAFRALDVRTAMLDGELVALRPDGVSSFPGLQTALKAGRDDTLLFYAFDLLHLDGWDLRPCTLVDRKAALQRLSDWSGMLRFSEHVVGSPAEVHTNAGQLGLEGIVCKRAGDPYRAGRGGSWLKVKCGNREELVVLGWTPPAGSRQGFGALHVGYYDPVGRLHYAGGVGSGYAARDLTAIKARLDRIPSKPPDMLMSGEPLDPSIAWVRPELVIEVQFAGWSGAGRMRHAVFLGIREDKPAQDVIREVADPGSERDGFVPPGPGSSKRIWHSAVPPRPKRPLPAPASDSKRAEPGARKPARPATIVVARAPRKARVVVGSVELTHPDRPLWPGITKQDLAAYWQAVAPHALPGLVHRPLSILRCPDGIDGEKFFQKNGHGYLPHQIREGRSGRQPYLAIDDLDGLFALAQMSAIELHPWGAPEADPTRPDHLVFDLDPGEGVPFADVVAAAHEVRARLGKLNLTSFCRTTGGKGLHVVVPLCRDAGWDRAKPFCRAFAETMAQNAPKRFLAHTKIADRRGRILVDWLRNGLGATAVASYCPRARPGAGVATPLAWSEVKPKLDPAAFTVLTVPKRLAKLKSSPWAGFDEVDQGLPDLTAATPSVAAVPKPRAAGTRIVVARKPKPKP